jgi:hypothetical protein
LASPPVLFLFFLLVSCDIFLHRLVEITIMNPAVKDDGVTDMIAGRSMPAAPECAVRG